eukprot:22911-Amorphochlora_amoeboformis.AAC.1
MRQGCEKSLAREKGEIVSLRTRCVERFGYGEGRVSMAKKNRRQKKKAAQQKAKAAEVDGSNSAKGKKAFVLGDYKRALQLFTEAIKEVGVLLSYRPTTIFYLV